MPRCVHGTQSHHRNLPRHRLRLTWRRIYLRAHRWLQKGWPEGPELRRARARTRRSSRLSQTQTLESNVEAAAACRVGNPEPARRPQPRSGRGPWCIWCTKAVKNLKPAAQNTPAAREKPHTPILEEVCLRDLLLRGMSGLWNPRGTEGTVSGVSAQPAGRSQRGVLAGRWGLRSHRVLLVAANPSARVPASRLRVCPIV